MQFVLSAFCYNWQIQMKKKLLRIQAKESSIKVIIPVTKRKRNANFENIQQSILCACIEMKTILPFFPLFLCCIDAFQLGLYIHRN